MTLINLLSSIEHKNLAISKDTPSDVLSVIRQALIFGYVSEVGVMEYMITEKGLTYLLYFRTKKNQDDKYPPAKPKKYDNPNLEAKNPTIKSSWILKHVWIIISGIIIAVLSGIILHYIL